MAKDEEKDNDSKEKDEETPFLYSLRFKALLFLLVVGGALYLLRGVFVAAVVNGKPIYRYTLVKELEKAYGRELLDNLVTQELILQEAEKQGLQISDEDIQAEKKTVEETLTAQGQTLSDALAFQGMTEEQFLEQLKIRLIVQKLSGEAEVTDEEIDQFVEENKDLFPEDTSEEEMRQTASDQLSAQKLSAQTQAWLQSLQDDANIMHFLFPEQDTTPVQ